MPGPSGHVSISAAHSSTSTQSTPAGPVYPALQTQSVMLSLPIGESVFAGQSPHNPDPFTLLYLPAKQALQAAPSDPSCPMLQMHSEM
eukprot:3711069-Rhodomonas_salina.5